MSLEIHAGWMKKTLFAAAFLAAAAPGFCWTDGMGASHPWTDDPIQAGTTPIRAVHITDLRDAVAVIRSTYGFAGSPTWTDTITAGATPVRYQHFTELQTYINQIRSTFHPVSGTHCTNADVVPLSYSFTAGVASGGVIRKTNLAELRQALDQIGTARQCCGSCRKAVAGGTCAPQTTSDNDMWNDCPATYACHPKTCSGGLCQVLTSGADTFCQTLQTAGQCYTGSCAAIGATTNSDGCAYAALNTRCDNSQVCIGCDNRGGHCNTLISDDSDCPATIDCSDWYYTGGKYCYRSRNITSATGYRCGTALPAHCKVENTSECGNPGPQGAGTQVLDCSAGGSCQTVANCSGNYAAPGPSCSLADVDTGCGTTCRACNSSGLCSATELNGRDPNNNCTAGRCRVCNGSSVCRSFANGDAAANASLPEPSDPKGECPPAQAVLPAGKYSGCYKDVCGLGTGECDVEQSGQDPDSTCQGTCQRYCDGTGGCTYATSGDPRDSNGPAANRCPVCKQCTGSVTSAACTANLLPDRTQDANVRPADTPCTGQCYGCHLGACTLFTSGTDPAGNCGTTADSCETGSCAALGACAKFIDYLRHPTVCTGTCKGCDSGGACANLSGRDDNGDCATCNVCNGSGSCRRVRTSLDTNMDPKGDCPPSGATYPSCFSGNCGDNTGACYAYSGTDPSNACGTCKLCNGGDSCRNVWSAYDTNMDPKNNCPSASATYPLCWTGLCGDNTGSCAPQSNGYDTLVVPHACTTCQVCNGSGGCRYVWSYYDSNMDPKSECTTGQCRSGVCGDNTGACGFQNGSDTNNQCGACQTCDGSGATNCVSVTSGYDSRCEPLGSTGNGCHTGYCESYRGGSVCSSNTVGCYRDSDGDGYGNSGNYAAQCGSCSGGYVSDYSDCDDTFYSASPAQTGYFTSPDNTNSGNKWDWNCNGRIEARLYNETVGRYIWDGVDITSGGGFYRACQGAGGGTCAPLNWSILPDCGYNRYCNTIDYFCEGNESEYVDGCQPYEDADGNCNPTGGPYAFYGMCH